MDENFKLKSFKLKGLDAEVRYTISNDGCDADYKVVLSKEIGSALYDSLDRMKEAASNILELTEEQEKRITARGIVLSGTGENVKAAIFCGYDTSAGTITFRTPRIAYKSAESEAAAIITAALPKIEQSVYDFLHNDTEELEPIC